MSLIYITGAPGIGKSTLKEEFIRRGYETNDMDDPDLGGAHNLASGERVEIPTAEHRQPNWFDEHEWRVYLPALMRLKDQASTKDIFVCGVAPDDTSAIPLFDTVIYLTLSDEELSQRLSVRSGNDYGKNDFELTSILERKKALDERHASLKSVSIPATGSVKELADKILILVSSQ